MLGRGKENANTDGGTQMASDTNIHCSNHQNGTRKRRRRRKKLKLLVVD